MSVLTLNHWKMQAIWGSFQKNIGIEDLQNELLYYIEQDQEEEFWFVAMLKLLCALVGSAAAIHVDHTSTVLVQEAFRSLEMLIGHRAAGLVEDRRLRRAARPSAGDVGGLEQQIAGRLPQLALPRRPEGLDLDAVGLQHRHVDCVQRGAGHESQDFHGNVDCHAR